MPDFFQEQNLPVGFLSCVTAEARPAGFEPAAHGLEVISSIRPSPQAYLAYPAQMKATDVSHPALFPLARVF